MFERQFADAIRFGLETKGLSVNAAARRAGIPTSTLQSYLADTKPSQPSFAKAVQICVALGIDLHIGPPRPSAERPDKFSLPPGLEGNAQMLNRIVLNAGGDPIPDDLWPALAMRHGSRTQIEEYEDIGPGGAPVCVVHSPIQTGDGSVDLKGRIASRIWFRSDWMDRLNSNAADCTIIRMGCQSMEPTLPRGSVVMIDPGRTERRDGRIYAAVSDQGIVVRRAVRSARKGWQLKPDNEDFPSMPWPRDGDILGRIVWTARHMVQLQ